MDSASVKQHSVTARTAEFVAASHDRELDAELSSRLKRHILDTLVACISGSTLLPGQSAHRYAQQCRWPGPANISGLDITVHQELAALINGMCAHADETDDVNDISPMHPGASIVPAALATAQAYPCDGASFLRAINAGYDMSAAFCLAAWPVWNMLQGAVHTAHGIGQSLGAAAASAVVARLREEQLLSVFSYTCQLASGFSDFYRDRQHVEKAFACAGMQARNGVAAVGMAAAGFSGVVDVFDTKPSAFDAFGKGGDPEHFLRLLKEGGHVQNVDLKVYPVGMPIQAAAEAMEKLLRQHKFAPSDVARVVCGLPTFKVHVVDGRHMPDINLQYTLAVIIADGKLGFHSARDYGRRGGELAALIDRIQLVGDATLDPAPGMAESSRRASMQVWLNDGRHLVERVDAAHGSRLRPLDWDGVEHKAVSILSAVGVPEQRIATLISKIQNLEQVENMDEIGSLVASSKRAVA